MDWAVTYGNTISFAAHEGHVQIVKFLHNVLGEKLAIMDSN